MCVPQPTIPLPFSCRVSSHQGILFFPPAVIPYILSFIPLLSNQISTMDDTSEPSTDSSPSTPVLTPTTSRSGDNLQTKDRRESSQSPFIFVNNVSILESQEPDSISSSSHRRSPSPFEQTIQFQVGSKRNGQDFRFKQLFNTTPRRREKSKIPDT